METSSKPFYIYKELSSTTIEKKTLLKQADYIGYVIAILKKKLYGLILWMGLNCLKAKPLRGGSLLFTIQFPEISGTHFIGLVRMKG